MKNAKRGAAAILVLGAVVWVTGAEAAEPTKDVKVVNTASEPVPVAVQGTAAVTGDVAVTNTPTVDLAVGASVKSADETVVLWSGLICGSFGSGGVGRR